MATLAAFIDNIDGNMGISSMISVRWDQLLGYTAGTGLALQSVKSAYLGLKEMVATFHGSETYRMRIERAATDNLNILSNAKNFTLGADTLSQRFNHFTNGLENLFISAVTGLFSYLLFFKAFESHGVPSETSLPDTTQLNEKFNEDLRKASSASQAFKMNSCLISNFFHPTSEAKLRYCTDKGYYSDEYHLPEDLTNLSEANKIDIFSCLKQKIVDNLFKSFLNQPEIQRQLKALPYENAEQTTHLIEDASKNKELAKTNSTKDLSTKITKAERDLLRKDLDALLTNFYEDFKSIYNGYDSYVEGYKERRAHHITHTMTKILGPFKFHFDIACDNKTFDQLPMVNNFDQTYCQKYNNLKKSVQVAIDQKSQVDDLDPVFANTDCNREVFSKVYDQLNQGDSRLSPNLYNAFTRLKKDLENN